MPWKSLQLYFRGERISWVSNCYLPHEKSWGLAPTYFFMGKIKDERPIVLHRENKGCKDLHDIKFTFYSWKEKLGYKIQS